MTDKIYSFVARHDLVEQLEVLGNVLGKLDVRAGYQNKRSSFLFLLP